MQKDDATWLKISLIVAGLVVALVYWHAFQMIGLRTGLLERHEKLFSTGSIAVALLFGAATIYAIVRSDERRSYLLASIGELRKVNWPTWDNTKKLTIIVVTVVAIFAVILSGFDWVLAGLWSGLLKSFLV